jgi:hypothetical protein
MDREANMEKNVNKNGWLWLAPQYFDSWRVFPRTFIIFYFWLCMETAMWFMGLPAPGPSQAAFASAIVGAGAAWFGLYVNSGPSGFGRNTPAPSNQLMPTRQDLQPMYDQPRNDRDYDHHGDLDNRTKG